MTEKRRIQLEAEVDTTRTRDGFQEIGQQANTMATTVTSAGERAGTAVGNIGNGADRAAAKVEASQRNLIASIQRTTTAMEAGGRSTAAYYEMLANQRNVSADALAPYIAALRAVEDAQARSAQTLASQQTAQRQAAEAAREQAAAQREVAQAQAGRDAFLNSLREQVALFGRSSDETLRYRAAQAGVSQEASHLILQLQNMRAAHEGIAAATRDEAAAAREAQQAQSRRDGFIASLQQQSEAIGRTRVELLEMQAAQMGVATQAAPFIARLREADSGIASTGMSARAMAASLRLVPAQLTDIVVGLQAGQAPMTVMLQQGGQLRDMFGSAGAAARALGGYVVSLITPLTVIAAAAVALGVAYHQGSKEADAYNKSIIVTGNVAGTTANQLSDMARSIGASVGTQGAAAEALASLVGTGRVSADNLQQFGKTAVTTQKALGIAVADTVSAFTDLGKDPLQATERLNDKYHYLTASVYAQIKALEDQGKKDEAGEVAQKAFSDALETRSTKMVANLGLAEKAWAGISGAAKKAWDAMLDVGRQETPEQEIERLQAKIAKAAKTPLTIDKKNVGDALFAIQQDRFNGGADARGNLDADKARVAVLIAQEEAKKRMAAIDAGRQKFDEADISWQKEGEQFLSRKAQLEKEVAKTRELGLAAGMSDVDIQKRVGEVRKKYSDIYNDSVNAQIEAIQRRGDIEEERAKRTRMVVTAEQALGFTTSLDSQFKYEEKLEALDQAAFEREKKRLQEKLALTAQKPNSEKDQAELRGQIAKVEEAQETRRLELKQKIIKLDTDDNARIAANLNALSDARSNELNSLNQQLQAQKDSNAEIGLSRTGVADLRMKIADETATRYENEASIISGNEARKKDADTMRESAARIREIAQAQRDGIIKQEDFERQRNFWSSIDNAAHQAFLSIGEGGKSVAQRLKDSFKSIFFDWLYQMTIKKWIINVGTGLGAPVGVFGSAASAASGPGSAANVAGEVGGAFSLAGAASNLYGALTGGATLSGGLGTGFLGSLAGGLNGAGIGSALESTLGMQIGNSIASTVGTSVAGALSTGLGAIATALPWVGGAMAALSLGKAAFGHGPKEVTSAGIQGTFGTDTFTGLQFQDWVKKGGWFSSDKKGTDTPGLDPQTQSALNTTYKSIKDATSEYAKALGLSTDTIDGYSKQIKLALTSDKDQNDKLIAEMFAGISNDLASSLLPNIAALEKAGESAGAALQRLAGDFAVVSASMKAIGVDADKAFGAVGAASLEARERLIALAGGIDKFGTQSEFFAQNFLTNEQKIAPTQKLVAAGLAELGYSSLKTVDDFRGAVLGLADSSALATESGAKTYAGLLKLAPAFFDLATYMDGVTKAAKELAETNLAKALRDAADEASNYMSGVNASLDAVKAVIDRDKNVVQQAYDAAMSGFTKRIDKLNDAIGKTKSIVDVLHGALDNLDVPNQGDAARAMAAAQLKSFATMAKAGGVLPDVEILRKAITGATKFSEDNYTSFADYQRDVISTRGDIAALGGIADDKLDLQQKQLDALTSQKDAAQAYYESQLNGLNSQLEYAQQQVDLLSGIDTSLMTLSQAMASLKTTVAAAQGNSAVGVNAQISAAYQQYLGRAPEQAGMEFYQKAYYSGQSTLDQIVNFIKNSPEAGIVRGNGGGSNANPAPWAASASNSSQLGTPETNPFYWAERDMYGLKGFASGGDFAGGLRIVGENGPELEATGPSRIFNASQTASMLRGGNSDALAQEVKELRKELSKSREEMNRALYAIAKNTMNTADHLDNAVNGDVPLTVSAI
jgi:phage-related minor tail protein